MSKSPEYKVYTADDEYIACTKYPSDAARLVSDGWTIRTGHKKKLIVWREGFEEQPANASYDFVAETILGRREAMRQEVEK